MSWQESLVIAAARSALLAGLAGVAIAALRVRRADARLMIWTGVLMASLAMPLLPALLPELVVAQRPVAAAATPAQPSGSSDALRANVLPVKSVGSVRAAVPASSSWNWLETATAAYLVVAIVLAMRLAFGLLGVARMIRRAAPVPELGGDVFETGELKLPATAGLLRPVVLLPADWRNWDPDTLEAVLAHERSHASRGDFAIQAISRVNRSLFWFNPLAWWLTRHIASLAEQACDDAALRSGSADRARYAEILLAFGAPENRADVNLVAMAHWRTLTARVERILDQEFLPGTPLPARRKAVVVGVMCVSACLIAAATVKAQQPVETPKVQPQASAPRVTPEKPSPIQAEGSDRGANDSWVILNGRTTVMSGSTDDIDRARRYRKDGQPIIWMRRDGKEYLVEDESLLQRLREILHEPHDSQGLVEGDLEGRLHAIEDLHRAMELEVEQQRVRKPDLAPHIRSIEAEVQRLKSMKLRDELSDEDLGELHHRVSELQAKINELEHKIGGLNHGRAVVLHERSEDLARQSEQIASEHALLAERHAKRAAEVDNLIQKMMKEALQSGKARRVGNF